MRAETRDMTHLHTVWVPPYAILSKAAEGGGKDCVGVILRVVVHDILHTKIGMTVATVAIE